MYGKVILFCGVSVLGTHLVLLAMTISSIRQVEERFGYRPDNTIYNHYIWELNDLPGVRELRIGDRVNSALFWFNASEARRRAALDAEQGRLILFAGNGRTWLHGLSHCRPTVLRIAEEEVVEALERDRAMFPWLPPRYKADLPGALDEVVCELDDGATVTLAADVLFGPCVYDPHHAHFLRLYNREALRIALEKRKPYN
jgi:hypothetical protein